MILDKSSDVDPDLVGSAFILGPWIRIQRYKMMGKAEFNQVFCRNLYFFIYETKKVAYLKGLGKDLKKIVFLDF